MATQGSPKPLLEVRFLVPVPKDTDLGSNPSAQCSYSLTAERYPLYSREDRFQTGLISLVIRVQLPSLLPDGGHGVEAAQ